MYQPESTEVPIVSFTSTVRSHSLPTEWLFSSSEVNELSLSIRQRVYATRAWQLQRSGKLNARLIQSSELAEHYQ